jgi:hypothetical protein
LAEFFTFLYSGALLAQNYQRKEISPLREATDPVSQEFCRARPTFDFRAWSIFHDWLEKLAGNMSVGEWISGRLVISRRRSFVPGAQEQNALPSFCMMYRLTAGL